MKKVLMILLLCFFMCGCSKHVIKHSISKSNIILDKNHILAIDDFEDERPEDERKGKTGKFLKFSSKDSHFKKSLTEHLDDVFKEEFAKVGLRVRDYKDIERDKCRYTLSGSLIHCQAAMQLPKTTVVPYVKQVTSIWTKDEFSIVIEIKVKLVTNATGKTLINKKYVFSEDKKLPTGLLSLARYSRGFNYKLKLLDAALSSVIEEIRDDVVMAIKNS